MTDQAQQDTPDLAVEATELLAAFGEDQATTAADESASPIAAPEVEATELYTVKVNGEELQVTRDELLSGYSRQADYTRKAQALAEERKALEATTTQRVAQSDESLRMKAVLLGLDHKMAQYDSIDWAAKTAENPAQAQADFMQLMQAKQIRDKLAGELATREQAEQQEFQATYAKQLTAAQAKLAELIPDFETVRPQLLAAGQEYGFELQELHNIVDPRLLVVLRDAAIWRKYMAEVAKQPSPTSTTAPVTPIKSRQSTPAASGFSVDSYLADIL